MPKRKVSAFGSSAHPGGFTVEITVEDMLALQPTWTAQRATDFLNRHNAETAHAMLQCAAAYLNDAAAREERAGKLS